MLRFYETVRRQDLKLYFPPKFVEEHAGNLPAMIVLEVADGEKWDVKLKKGDDDHRHQVWLSKGWSEFANFYSIQPGHLLQFTYEGNYHFHVIIYDKCAMEIDYPSSFHCKEEYDSDASVQIVEDFPTYKRAAPTDQCIRPQNRNLTDRKGTEARKAKTTMAKRSLSESTRGLNVPYFVAIMKESYAKGNYMHLPKNFVEEYIEGEDIMVILRDSDGKTWPVRFQNSINARFNAGWMGFARDKKLKGKERLKFEMIKEGNQISFQVTILRRREH